MSTPTLHHDLPPVFAHEDCAALFAFLTGSAGQPVTLDGSATTRMGGLPAQMIAAARAIWKRDGLTFDIANPSDALLADLRRLDLHTAILPADDAA